MKTFTTEEIKDLLNQVYNEEISFSQMVEILNKRVSEAADIPEEPKKGDLAIFWDKVKRHAIITFYERSYEDETCLRHKDIAGSGWENAIKFESKEQYEQFIKENI